uniref:Ubiquitin carboxyl-terminal hydrolase n=1 Tax=Parascaris equorum TaxID=6256 RepID=A0A914RRV8_PAREQ
MGCRSTAKRTWWVSFPFSFYCVRLLGSLGYNEVAERIVNGDQDTESCILADFLQSTASQLTVYGLFELNAALNDGQIAVLFRNNHFHTLYKHKESQHSHSALIIYKFRRIHNIRSINAFYCETFQQAG